jgi:hypothetical protein
MMVGTQKIEAVNEAAKSAPPLAVVVAGTFGGLSLNDWVMIATLVYIALQVGWLLYKWYKAAKTKNWAPRDE